MEATYREAVLPYPENYGPYAAIAKGEIISIDVSVLTKETWQNHYDSVLNIFKDGIESEIVQSSFIRVKFADSVEIELALTDYLLNLIMWNMLIRTGIPICSKHIFFDDEIKKDTIKRYIDVFLIDENRKRFTNKELNNIIDDTLYRIHDIDMFAMFLSNTVNLEDNVFLMEKSDGFNECMHVDITGVPIEDVKSYGMEYANRSIAEIKSAKGKLGYDHCLADAFRASEGINPKQFKEFTINLGTKPDGHGSIYPYAIPTSFINGGVDKPLPYLIESSTGRIAQIIKYNNVGSSGHFARLLGLNNMDSYLNSNPKYDCHSPNYLTITIKDTKTLRMLNNRYYRLHPDGMEKIIKARDMSLIGKTIYLRSPITCASAAKGHGVCYKCYGDLAYTVYDADIEFGVNIGRVASEILSSRLTQKLLSAKHLLETFAEKVTWVRKFNELFEIEGDLVRLNSEVDTKDYRLVIDPDAIEMENEEDDDLVFDDDDSSNDRVSFNEYICEFDVFQNSTEEIHHISNDKGARLYISTELNGIIRRKGEPVDGKIFIDFNELRELPLFTLPIQNNELSKTLNHLEGLLNKNTTIKGMDLNQLLQALIDTVIEGGIDIASTHLEVILSNQVRDANDILSRPNWYYKNPPYEILSLNRALTCNPSITIAMSYQKVSKLLYNPLTFKRNGASFMDLFFMEQPQYAINGMDVPEYDTPTRNPGDIVDPFEIIDNPDKITVFEDEPDDSE